MTPSRPMERPPEIPERSYAGRKTTMRTQNKDGPERAPRNTQTRPPQRVALPRESPERGDTVHAKQKSAERLPEQRQGSRTHSLITSHAEENVNDRQDDDSRTGIEQSELLRAPSTRARIHEQYQASAQETRRRPSRTERRHHRERRTEACRSTRA